MLLSPTPSTRFATLLPAPWLPRGRSPCRKPAPKPCFPKNRNVERTARNGSGAAVTAPKRKAPVELPFRDEEPVEMDDLPVVEDDDWGEPDDLSEELDLELDLTGDDDHIDDPVRIYLMQMGEIPLLSRSEEIAAAKRIERTPHALPPHACWPPTTCCRRPSALLEKVRDGKLRLDRTIEVSVINVREKRQHHGPAGAEPRARCEHLLQQNRRDFAHRHRQAAAARRSAATAWRRLVGRRGKAVRLVEELGLRTQRLQPLLGEAPADLAADGRRSSRQLAELRGAATTAERGRRAAQGTALPDADHAGKPGHAAPPRAPHRRAASSSTTPPSATSRPATCGWWSRSPSAIATAA